jgi:predicted DNA-binding transcriptional regulator AlpA
MASVMIDEWCKRHNLSRSMFYKLKNSGKAPRTMMIGTTIRITDQADAEWMAAREAETAAAKSAAR